MATKGRPARQHTHKDHRSGGPLDGRAAKNVADLGHTIPIVYRVDVSGAGPNFVVSSSLFRKMRIVSVWGYMTGAGGAGDTVKVDDGTNDITDTVDLSAKADTEYFTVGQIDDAYNDLAAGDTLRVVSASSAACDLFIMAVPVA